MGELLPVGETGVRVCDSGPCGGVCLAGQALEDARPPPPSGSIPSPFKVIVTPILVLARVYLLE